MFCVAAKRKVRFYERRPFCGRRFFVRELPFIVRFNGQRKYFLLLAIMSRKMSKKLLSIVLLSLLSIFCLLGFTACAQFGTHEHDYVDCICTVCGNCYLPYELSEDGTYCIIDCQWCDTFEFSDIVIPAEIDGIPVKEIDGFSGHEEITSVKIPNSVTTIKEMAFYNCTNLATVIFGNNVTTIGDHAFQGCEALRELNIPSTITKIAAGVFAECKSLTTLTLPENLTHIGSLAFSGCTNLTTITFPESLTSIDYHAFLGCASLTEITLPESLTFLGKSAFAKCTNLSEVVIHPTITYVGDCAFENCDLRYNEYSDGYYLGDEQSPYTVLVKAKNDSATNFDVNEATKIICDNVFNGFKSLANITFPKGLTQIGDYAFSGCAKLSSLTIPKTLKAIGFSAFSDCEGLNSVYINDLNAWMQIDFDVFNSNPLYLAHKLYLNDELVTDLIIDGVETVSPNAFVNCKNLKTVIIGDSVTEIGESAFSGCNNLFTVTVGKNVIKIGDSAFGNCGKLVEVINLSSIRITKSSPTYGSLTDNSPNGGIANNKHVSIIDNKDESKIVNLNDYSFYTYENINYLIGYDGLETTLILPEDYNGQSYEIYLYAFAHNENIEKVVISDGVTTIGGGAFSN